jgi:general secretion pathway protein C
VVININTWLPNVPRYIELLMVILLAWFVTSWWQTGDIKGALMLTTLDASQEAKPLLDIKKIANTPIFGVKKALPIVQKEVIKPVVLSRLKITLLGTVLAGERSAAVVALNGKQQVFVLGDTIQAGVTLTRVEAAAIVIDNSGRIERIELKKGKAIVGAHFAKPTKTQRVQHALKRSYLNQEIGDFAKLLSQARVLPHFRNGKPDGFVINEIARGSLYQKIGLKNGDILRKVNGVEITGAKQAMAMYQKLQSATSIDLELLRNNAIMPIHYEIK